MERKKFALSDPATETFTWRQIRDALRASGLSFDRCCSGFELSFNLHRRALTEALRSARYDHHGAALSRKSGNKAALDYLAWEFGASPGRKHPDRPVREVLAAMHRDAVVLVHHLHAEGLIKPFATPKGTDERLQRWLLTPTGASLLNQKALAGLKRDKCGNLLRRVVEVAHAHNRRPDEGCAVTRIYLFGSTLDPQRERFGDIDLLVEVRPWDWPEGMTFDQWRQREYEWASRYRSPRSGMDAACMTTEPHAAKRINAVSPYVSIMAFDTLQLLRERGEPVEMLFAFNGPVRYGSDVTPAERAAASHTRQRLAAEMGTPALAAEWDAPLAHAEEGHLSSSLSRTNNRKCYL